jgi:hypothetical protein
MRNIRSIEPGACCFSSPPVPCLYLALWPGRDHVGVHAAELQAVTDTHVILPKLFRRLVEFLRGGRSVTGFKTFMEKKAEPITILPGAHFTHFDTVLDVQGITVRMTERPENLVFNS